MTWTTLESLKEVLVELGGGGVTSIHCKFRKMVSGLKQETDIYIYILPCNLNMKTKLHHNLHPGNFTWISKMMFFLVYLLSIVAILGINSLMFRVTNWDGGVKPESYRNSMGCS